MIRNVEARLRKLEAEWAPTALNQWHRVIGRSAEECEAARSSMIAAGNASQGDSFIFLVIVSLKCRAI
jgi:hypothetical protein